MLWCCGAAGLVSGCATLPYPTPPAPVAVVEAYPENPRAGAGQLAPTTAIRDLILTERQAAIAGDLFVLAEIWAVDGRVVDRRGTVDPADDYIWPGRAGVLDRYVVAVFPNPPPPLTLPADLPIEVHGNEATVQHGRDHWRFVQHDGRWWIVELVYNRPL